MRSSCVALAGSILILVSVSVAHRGYRIAASADLRHFQSSNQLLVLKTGHASLKTRPTQDRAPKPVTQRSPVASKGPIHYDCTQTGGGSSSLSATFYQTRPVMVLVEQGGQARPAFQVRAASGAKYEGTDIMFWESKGEALVTWSGIEFKCKTVDGSVPTSSEGLVTGTLSYRQRIALTPDAVIEVKLLDVSRAGAPAITIAEQTITPGGRQVPIAFEIRYDPSHIDVRHTYVIQARILEGGQLRFINSRAYPVITRGHPKTVNMILVPVGQ